VGAYERERAIQWAAQKMAELARAGDSRGVSRVYEWALIRARGSNARKWELQAAYEAARKLLRTQ
jgi:hypothetical protein